MAIQISQKFPRCTLCGKMLPLASQPIVIGHHRLCSMRCLELLPRLRPDEMTEVMREELCAIQKPAK